MKAAVITEILAAAKALNVDESTRQQFIGMVCQISARHGLKVALRTARVDCACRLLELKVSRPTIRNRLMAHYGMSERQAYRTIDQAMKLCQKSQPFGKSFANHPCIDDQCKDFNADAPRQEPKREGRGKDRI